MPLLFRDDAAAGGRGRTAAAITLLSVALAAILPGAARAAPLEEPLQPIPRAAKQDPARVELGRRLFNDVRLSSNDRLSCASCHDLKKGGGDGRATAVGFGGTSTEVNTPTVLNAALNFRQFWNGRANSLEAQIGLVVQSPIEMGSTWDDVVRKILADDKYRSAFASIYPEGVSKASIQNAIATYERTLTTPDSRFDRFLRGDANAISAAEKAGYAAFKQYGCVACHQGVNVGGNMFQKFGTMGDYFAGRARTTPGDLGRFAVTGNVRDRHVFKVPSLRNVARTAPYFHDGSARTLEDAVDVMFIYQLGRVASPQDKDSIVRFLETLTADVDRSP